MVIETVFESQLVFNYFNGLMVETLNNHNLWREADDVCLQIVKGADTWHVVAEVSVYNETYQETETVPVAKTPEFTCSEEVNPFTNPDVTLGVKDLISVVIHVLNMQKLFQGSLRST